MFALIVGWNKFVEKSEKLLNLLSWEVCIIVGILYLKCIDVRISSGYDIWQRTKAWIADWNTHSMESILLQEFHEDILTVEASLPPSSNFGLVNLSH